MIFETVSQTGHEQIVFCHSKDAGLKAIIAIHNSVLGPALGGLRMWPYKSEQEAVNDVLRLSRSMTYKNAVAGLNIGGGKAVIIGDPAKDKSEALFRSFGRFINSLHGRYITAEDVGIDVNDMEYVYRETEFVTGVHQVHGGSGDPSPFTAYGALQGVMATLNYKHGNEDVGKYRFAVHVFHVVDVDADVFGRDVTAVQRVDETAERAEQGFGLVLGRIADDHRLAAAQVQARHRVLVGHAARQPQHVVQRFLVGPVRPHPQAAQRRAQHGVVDRDDGLQAGVLALTEHDLLVAGGGDGFEKHRVTPVARDRARLASRRRGAASGKRASRASKWPGLAFAAA